MNKYSLNISSEISFDSIKISKKGTKPENLVKIDLRLPLVDRWGKKYRNIFYPCPKMAILITGRN